MLCLNKTKPFDFDFAVSGLRNTAYSQFYIEQLNQTNSTRTAILKTNRTFDYDTAGRIKHKNFQNIRSSFSIYLIRNFNCLT
jgi:hypothetical protein